MRSLRLDAPVRSRQLRATTVVLNGSYAALAVAFLVSALEGRALAQSNDERGGFAVRELSLSTGYAFVQLPLLTLGGKLPGEVLDADLVTNGTVEIDWRHVTPRTRYSFDLFGTYTARKQYSRLNAPGGNLSLGVLHALGKRWRLGAGIASTISGSDQLVYQPTQTRQLVDGATSFGDLAGAVALARSPHPDSTQAALFLPIGQSLVASDLYTDRVMASSVRANATYLQSVRLTAYFQGSRTVVRRISSNHDPERLPASPDSTADSVRVGVRYDRSERTQLTAALDWSQASGVVADRVVVANVGYGWSGRKWFTSTTIGTAVRPFPTPVTTVPLTTVPIRTPVIVYSGSLGYKFRAQTLLVQYSRAAHDEYGRGGRNSATGFAGNVQSIAGSWSWSAPASRWIASSDFSMLRRPGNFSYIYTWLSTAGLGRQLRPNVRVMGELLFDRHGSRAFEGFSLMREEARVNVIWTPRRRSID